MENKNQEIQALRGVAIVFVLFHHYKLLLPGLSTDWYRYVEGMWSGVDLFFCISGYVISRNFIFELNGLQGAEFWKRAIFFWIKRSYRILPSAWLWVFITFSVVVLVGWGNKVFINQNLMDGLAAIFQVANFHFWQCTVDKDAQCGTMSIYWSLSLEEQFYLLLPVLVYILRGKLGYFLLIVLAAQFFLPRHHWEGIFSFIRTDAIIFGVLLSYFEKYDVYELVNPENIPIFKWPIVAPLLIVGLAFVPSLKLVSFYLGLTSLICFVILWLASYDKGYVFAKGRLRSVLEWIGERSFSIYLIHLVSFSIVRLVFIALLERSGEGKAYVYAAILLVGICFTLVLANANYIYVECHWRILGKKVVNRLK